MFFGNEDLDINESYQRKVSSATSELKVCVYLIKACEAIFKTSVLFLTCQLFSYATDDTEHVPGGAVPCVF